MTAVAAEAYRFGPFLLEVRERRLWRAGERVQLTPRALDTLLLLVSRGGSLVPREELLAAVWSGTVVEESNLTHTVWLLRSALGDRFIETVPKTGYRFAAAVESVASASAGPLAGSTHGEAPESADALPRSLAILPLKALSTFDHSLELCQGVADLLITRLSTLPDVVVRPLRAVLAAARDEDPLVTARALGSEAVVDASLQRAGSRVRVNARLLRVSDGNALVAETFDAEWGDLFAVQDRLAARIADALAPRLDPKIRARLAHRTTRDSLAMELYLQGRYSWERRTTEAVDRALDFYRRALDRDSEFALAWAAKADAYGVLPMTSDRRPLDCLAKARDAIRRALAIDTDLAEAHSAAGLIAFWYDWDWAAAEISLNLALAASPSLVHARLFHAHLMSNTGRHDEARVGIDQALAIDPSSPILNALKGMMLVHARRYDDALAQFDSTLAGGEDNWVALLNRGKLHLVLERYDDADEDLLRAAELSGGSAQALSMLTVVAARRGDAAEARRRFATLAARAAERWIPPTDRVIARAACGDPDATAGLAEAVAERDPRLAFLGVDPKWDALARDPRVVALRRDLRLPGASQTAS